MSSPAKFVVTIPVKPYVKRFVELNYSLPADFSKFPELQKEFRKFLKKPSTKYEVKYENFLDAYTETVEVYISQDDFYRHGWELSKTDTVNFGKIFEKNAKCLMRTQIGIFRSLGKPLYLSINEFQASHNFEEEYWQYQSILKDFQRNGSVNNISFEEEIFQKIRLLSLRNLLALEVITPKYFTFISGESVQKKDRFTAKKTAYETV